MEDSKALPSPTTEHAQSLTTSDDDNARELEVLLARHKIPAAVVDKLKETNRRLYLLYDAGVIFRPASADQLKRAHQKSGKELPKAIEEMVSFLVVYPSKEAYAEMLVDAPLIWATISDAVADIAKNRAVTDAVKL